MKFRLLTHPEQLAAHLRSEILKGRWTAELPGADRLGAEFGVNHTTVGAAISLLEGEGLLINQGVGRPRRIAIPENYAAPSLRVAILLYEQIDRKLDYMVELQHRLLEAGHAITIPQKTLVDLRMDIKRIAKLVEETKADAWIVQAGSKEVLEWFAAQAMPAFAMAGRRRGVNIASTGPDKLPALRAALRRLHEFGHRRIVMLVRKDRRIPTPGHLERGFLDELQVMGIATGIYNLPDWEETTPGLHRLLETLFRYTPPTAMIIDEAPLYLAVELHLTRLGFPAPERVSLVCLDPSPSFKWHRNSVAYVEWDSRPMIEQAMRWANNVACGRYERIQTFSKAVFMEGGTIGPEPA